MAGLLAREASHALRDLDGTVKTGTITREEIEACIWDEISATRAEMETFHGPVGTEGLGAARHRYEVQLNAELAESLGTAEEFAQRVRRDATGQCRD